MYEQKLLGVAHKSMKGATDEVLDNTPVRSGNLKASWNPSNGGPRTQNRSGGNRANFDGVIASTRIGDTYSVANGRHYARMIEYEGWSQQAPNGMVQPMVGNWQQIVNKAVIEER